MVVKDGGPLPQGVPLVYSRLPFSPKEGPMNRIAAALCVASLAALPASAETLKVKVDGDKATAIKMAEQLNKHGKDKDLQFQLVDADYQFRIAAYTEGVSATDMFFGSGGADSAAAVLDPNCEMLFIVSRSGRATQGGALNAVSKELVKKFRSYLQATGGAK